MYSHVNGEGEGEGEVRGVLTDRAIGRTRQAWHGEVLVSLVAVDRGQSSLLLLLAQTGEVAVVVQCRTRSLRSLSRSSGARSGLSSTMTVISRGNMLHRNMGISYGEDMM